jgi:hypothetical protein
MSDDDVHVNIFDGYHGDLFIFDRADFLNQELTHGARQCKGLVYPSKTQCQITDRGAGTAD